MSLRPFSRASVNKHLQKQFVECQFTYMLPYILTLLSSHILFGLSSSISLPLPKGGISRGHFSFSV